ncbi:hypothetical protein [Brachybacterium phenoliresistens]|uniref:hypothetical protein n=1 Tax=Brachybacterium phenoliresistens TaxID=396014 RepID=UPI0031E1ECF9
MKNSDIHAWDDLSTPFFSLSNSLWALVPLEAWRRGLTVSLGPEARYVITDGQSRREFRQTRLSGAVQDRIARESDDKHATRDLLLAAGLPTPQGRSFTGDIDLRAVRAYAESLGFPVCLKPNSWAKGRGVFPKLESVEQFDAALEHLVTTLGCDDIVVEQHIRGGALRVFVVGRQVVAVTLAEPANVTGDGSSTVAELVAEKTAVRRGNPHLRNHALAIDADAERVLAAQGADASTVPDEGQVLFLREAANLAQGGDSLDLTDTLPESIKQIAIDAVDAVEGLSHAGVDLLVEDPSDPGSQVFINELNPSAGLGGHIYPAYGSQRNVPAAIIDHYFPGTKRRPHSSSWYFPLNQTSRLLTARAATMIEMPPMPSISKPAWRRIRIAATSHVLPKLRLAILARLNREDVHGDVGRIADGTFDVLLAGDERPVEQAVSLVRQLAGRSGGTAKIASRRAFGTSVGVQNS